MRLVAWLLHAARGLDAELPREPLVPLRLSLSAGAMEQERELRTWGAPTAVVWPFLPFAVDRSESKESAAVLAGRFGPAGRLTHDAEFQAVFDAKVKKAGGGLVVFARPNGLRRPRLGLSVGRGAGGAVERNRVKRLIREAFRGLQADVPRLGRSSYDIVVGARSAKGLTLDGVGRTLRQLIAGVHGVHEKRAARERGA